MSTTTEKLLFDRNETAAMLRISPVTLFRLMKSGRINYLKIGDRPFWRRSDIDQFIEAQLRPARHAKAK
jgi:hypothetical protein